MIKQSNITKEHNQIFIRKSRKSELSILYGNMGNVYYDKGEYEKTLQYNKKSLDIAIKIYGEEHPYTANIYNQIALIHSQKGNYKQGMNKAEALQQAKLQYPSNAKINRTHPFYWAGFYLVGDTSPIQFNNYYWSYWVLGLIILGILLVSTFWYRRKRKQIISI